MTFHLKQNHITHVNRVGPHLVHGKVDISDHLHAERGPVAAIHSQRLLSSASVVGDLSYLLIHLALFTGIQGQVVGF